MKDGEASNPMDMFGGMMGGMGANEDMVMAMHMNNGMNPGQMNAENLGSGQPFAFTSMQNKFW